MIVRTSRRIAMRALVLAALAASAPAQAEEEPTYTLTVEVGYV
jgi:hypothetical protein